MKRAIALAIISLCLAAPATAITVNEPPDHSSSNTGRQNAGTLTVGINTFNGSLTGFCRGSNTGPASCGGAHSGTGSADLHDTFFFTVAAGHQLTGASISTYSGTEAPSDFLWISEVYGVSNLFLGQAVLGIGQSHSFSFAPTSPGDHAFLISAETSMEGGDFNFNWTANFTVASIAAVPLPAGAALLLTALAGLALLRRRIRSF